MKIRRKVVDSLKNIYAELFLNGMFSSELSQDEMEQQINNNDKTDQIIDSPYKPPKEQETYEEEDLSSIPNTTIKPIAFYLPQYYPFEENNRFWGKGFTEWHNVSRALPLFPGHYQPRLAGELGYYDLRLKEVMKRQIELAGQHGIYGFCFHHYYLDNKPIMRKPIDLFLKNKDLVFKFCLHWANESWTVRWDGEKQKGGVLLNQTHDDTENMGFIKDALPAFRDERYIRVEGKPVLLIYRPALFPDLNRTADKWRKYCKNLGLNGLYIVLVHTFFDNSKNPKQYGCDAAVEFPPHQSFIIPKKLNVPYYTNELEINVFDYKKLAAFSMKMKQPSYTLFRGIMPDWDNTARTKTPKIYHGSSPAVYQEWLTRLLEYTKDNLPADRQFVFINAWNEWAEGAYLEPDRKYGYAYLNATAKAMINKKTS